MNAREKPRLAAVGWMLAKAALGRLRVWLTPRPEPTCTFPGGHFVGEYDPLGGWWCEHCERLFLRVPRNDEV